MLYEIRNGQNREEMSETLGLAERLQALTDENLYLERRLEAMVLDNQMLQSMCLKNPISR